MALPLVRFFHILILLTELFALLFINQICTPLIPSDPSLYCNDEAVQKPLTMNHVPKVVSQSHSLDLNASALIVTKQRFCLNSSSNGFSDLFQIPNFDLKEPQAIISFFGKTMILAGFMSLWATLLVFWAQKSSKFEENVVLKSLIFVQLSLGLVQHFAFTCLYVNWKTLWTGFSILPEVSISFYVAWILIVISFIVALVDSFVITPRFYFFHRAILINRRSSEMCERSIDCDNLVQE